LFTYHERSFDITLSIGLVLFDPREIGAVPALGQADIACRIAKEKGRDRVHVYGHRDAESVRHRGDLALVPAIGRALSEGRFRVMAQPIQSLRESACPVHYEILTRMQDEKGNPVVPDTFIGVAERHILMPAIDRWVISHVFSRQSEQLGAWSKTYPDRFMLALNLSGTTLTDDGFTSYLKRQFAEYDIPYQSICFEITETAAVADLRRARSFMQEIRALGSCFAVDDFGTGFASYAYLKSLPVDYLKIDGSFVRHLETDPVDRALVSSINHIGHVLGMKTIAEWAETPRLVETLREIGVDYAQGFGVGRLLHLEDLRLPPPASFEATPDMSPDGRPLQAAP
jgi:EAL domain-containing protein (putative c-di-GMP-specific phosphodiesterase class I)